MSYETVLNGKIPGGSGVSSLTGDYTQAGIWMLDYKTYGENSYVFQDKNIWKAFMESPIAVNDKATSALVLDYAINQNGHIGKVISNIYGIDNSYNFQNYATLNDLILNCSDGVNYIMNSDYRNILLVDSVITLLVKHSCYYNSLNKQAAFMAKAKPLFTTNLITTKENMIININSNDTVADPSKFYFLDLYASMPQSAEVIIPGGTGNYTLYVDGGVAYITLDNELKTTGRMTTESIPYLPDGVNVGLIVKAIRKNTVTTTSYKLPTNHSIYYHATSNTTLIRYAVIQNLS